MADNEVQAGTTTDKHDDFFDEPPKHNAVLTPEPLKENGEVEPESQKENGDTTPIPPETTASANDEGVNGDGDATAAAVNGDEETQGKEDGQNEGAADRVEEANAGSEETPANAAADEEKLNGIEQMNGEEDGITSNPPTPTVEPAQEPEGSVADGEKADEDKPGPEEQESEPPTTTTTELRNEEGSQTPEEGGQEKQTGEEEQQQEEEHRQSPTEQEERRTPSGGEDNYDDSFSDDSSLKNATEGEAVTVITTGPSEDEVQAPVAGEDENEKGDTGESGTDPPRTAVSPSPSDSRAEAGAVVPVVAVTEDTKINDGRSSVTADDQGELFRGEDRKEEPAPEGSEDCRGQGQWQSEERQYIASAILVEKSDKEALEEAVKEKEKLHEEYTEAKVKDLQERLAILARENEQKDKRISKLEQDVVDVTEKLRETERKLFATEKLNQQHQEAPKSKTCTIM